MASNVTPGSCSLTLASLDGDTFNDAHQSDILFVASDCSANGAILAGFYNSALSNTIESTLRIDGSSLTVSANVGINTSTPMCALDVSGDVRTTGMVYASGFIVINDTHPHASKVIQVAPRATTSSQTSSSSSGQSSQTNGIDVITYLQNNGLSNIGVGLSNPKFPLDIACTTSFSSNVLATRFSNVGGVTYVDLLKGNKGFFHEEVTITGCTFTQTLSNAHDMCVSGTVLACNVSSCHISTTTISSVGDVQVGGMMSCSNINSEYARFGSVCNSGDLCVKGYVSTQSISNIGGLYVGGSLVASNITASYVSSQILSNIGGMYVGGDLAASNISSGVACFRFTSNMKDVSVGGTLVAQNLSSAHASTLDFRCSNSVTGFATTSMLCNTGDVVVGGGIYASSIIGADLQNCRLPYSSLIGAPLNSGYSNGAWSVFGSNLCIGFASNIGVGTSNPMCALDVNGDVRSTGAMYASSFILIEGGSSAITLPSSQTSTSQITTPPTQDTLRIGRNRLINGGMSVDQRNGGVTQSLTHTKTMTYIADRFFLQMVGSLGIVQAQTTTLPSPLLDLTKCISIRVSTPSMNQVPNANECLSLSQCIEGLSICDLQWGTSSALPITVSFWMYSSTTGTFGVSISNGTSKSVATRSFVSPFTIVNSNSWTRICIPITGDTTLSSNLWSCTETAGATLTLTYMCGSVLCTPSPNSWTSGNFLGIQNQSNLMSAAGASMCVTGIQFEIGIAATCFETRPYLAELQACKRYLHVVHGPWQTQMNIGQAGAQGLFTAHMPVAQRSNPSVTFMDALTPSSGVFIFGAGSNVLASFNSINPFEMCSGTQDISMVASWTPTAGLFTGQTANCLIGDGAKLSFDSDF